MKGSGKRSLEDSNCTEKDGCAALSSKRKLTHVLECPVCANICRPPIYSCATGHSVCNDCRKKFKQCCLCKSKMTNTRNFIAEEIVETFIFPCEYKEKGCTARLMGRNYEDHVEDCLYGKTVKCHLSHLDHCDQNALQMPNYMDHLALHHKVQELLGNNGSFSVLQTLYDYKVKDTCIWKGLSFAYDSKTFLPLTFLSSDVFFFSLGILGSDVEAKRYQVTIKLKHPLRFKLQLGKELNAVTVPVLPVNLSSKEWLKSHCQLTARVSKFNLQQLSLVDETPMGFSLEWLTNYEINKVPDSP